MSPLVAIIPSRNEEKNIARCIKSVLWCDRVVVLFMGTDTTGDIAKKLGAQVFEMKKTGKDDFIQVQKNINWAIDNIKCDWMLRIDADEVVTPRLHEEIIKVTNYKAQATSPVAYGISRSQFFCGGFLKGGDWAYDRLVRLFRPGFCRYSPFVSVHEQFKVNGKIGYLKNKLLHFSHPTLKDAISKFHKYTDVEINDLKETKLTASFKMICLPFYVFFRWLLWHYGWRDGARGILAAFMRGWYEYLLYSKYLKKTLFRI